MAIAYPEGECFFLRSALSRGFPNTDLNNPAVFYKWMLVEIDANCPYRVDYFDSGSALSHPRALASRRQGSGGTNPMYTANYFRDFTTVYGTVDKPNTASNGTSRVRSWLCQTPANNYIERHRGVRSIEVEVYQVNMPEDPVNEPMVWIDMVKPIRAVYFPLAMNASEDFAHLCTYVQINFIHQGTKPVWRPDGSPGFANHVFSPSGGTGMYINYMIGFNVKEIITLLSIPRPFRNTNIWKEKLVMIRPGSHFVTPPALEWGRNGVRDSIEFPALVNSSFAVELQYKPVPPQPPPSRGFLSNLCKGIVDAAIGLIPVVGPLLSAGFTIGWEATTNPDGFKGYLESGQWAGNVISGVTSSASDARKYIDPGWLQARQFSASAATQTSAAEDATSEGGGADDVDGSRYSSHRKAEAPDDLPPDPILLAGLMRILQTVPFKAGDEQQQQQQQGAMSVESSALLRAAKNGLIGEEEAGPLQFRLARLDAVSHEGETVGAEAPEGEAPQ